MAKTIHIFSLTDAGRVLAQRVTSVFPNVRHQHKPDNFITTVQTVFSAGHPCLFICSTGIVIRALAPVLTDKTTDPAVVVLDEQGRFVIPLLSGHEGGAGALAYRLATALGAECVVTSHTDYSRPIYALGMGSDRGCPVSELRSLFDGVTAELAPGTAFHALASIELKRDEPAFIAFSQQLDLPFVVYDAATLCEYEPQLSVRSPIVFRETGCYGVAEAAALCAASEATGRPAELIITKRKNKRATIAVARSYLPRS